MKEKFLKVDVKKIQSLEDVKRLLDALSIVISEKRAIDMKILDLCELPSTNERIGLK